MTNKEFLLSNNTYATTLLAILVDTYGLPELVDWEPETLERQVMDDFGVKLSDVNRDKIWALLTLMSTNLFYVSLEAFCHICCALTNDDPGIQIFDPPSPEQIAWALYEVTFNETDFESSKNIKFNPEMYSEEIRKFVRVILDFYGVNRPPDLLGMLASPKTTSPDEYMELNEDPVLTSAKLQRDTETAMEIQKLIKENSKALITQLNEVKLTHSDKKNWNTLQTQFLEVLIK